MRIVGSWLFVLVTGCSSVVTSGAAPRADAAADVGTAAQANDAGDGAAKPSTCDVAPDPASVPEVASEVVIADGDGGGLPPAATGGDVAGLWFYSKLTLYLAPAARGEIDPSKSKITGFGWLELGGGRYRTSTDTVATLATKSVGELVTGSTAKAKGTYTSSGNDLTFAPDCRESSAAATSETFAFSRLSPTTARFSVSASSQLGEVTLVADLIKAN